MFQFGTLAHTVDTQRQGCRSQREEVPQLAGGFIAYHLEDM